MNVELISIGDELLIGQTINTNASFIGQSIAQIGGNIQKAFTVSDKEQDIVETLKSISKNTNCVIITGGLGPTKDDITKHTLAKYFNTKLILHQPTLKRIEDFFMKRNRPMLESNIKQAELPKDCQILTNKLGTAAGMLFRSNNCLFFSLPGVPYEMKGLMEEEVIPILKKDFSVNSVYFKTALTQGIGESFLAEKIINWENKVRDNKLSLAYLPSPGLVKLRLTSYKGKRDKLLIDTYFKELNRLIPEHLFGFNEDSLASVVGDLLRINKLKIGTVESCTAGFVSNQLTSISGSSDYYIGSLICYTNKLKTFLANVSEKSIEKHGAVSEKVAREMALGGQKNLGVDVCLSITGIAGPKGGTSEKPVGTVWIGLAIKEKVYTQKFVFGDNRQRNIKLSSLAALNYLRIHLIN